ncbi:MAG TPA: Rieske 2Fe-2S domain-containing protein [Acidimicrobiales bacterium]|nr:Rieske 2Fe-2S domain-containing protein [Acidimicrobiales bacterium]
MFRALRSDELPAGEDTGTQIRRIRMGEGHVMVARLLDGRLVAFGPSCPHQLTPLDDATLRDGVMRCPRHGYQYDATTGANVFPTRDASPENLWKLKPKYLPVHDVTEHDGWIWVSDEPSPPPEGWDPALEERPGGAGAAGEAGTAEAEAEAAPAAAVTSTLAVTPAAPVEQSMKFLTATAGEVFEIRVAATPVEGHHWRLEVVGGLLEIVEDQFEPGEIPCQRVRLIASGAGAATLTCTYANSDGQPAAIRTYIIRVSPAS